MSVLSLSLGSIVHLGDHLKSGVCFQINGIDPLSWTYENIYSLPLASASKKI
jgi:hypothetical protein